MSHLLNTYAKCKRVRIWLSNIYAPKRKDFYVMNSAYCEANTTPIELENTQ